MPANAAKAAAITLMDDLQAKFPLWPQVAEEHVKFRAEEWTRRTQLELAADNPFASHEQDWEDFVAKVDMVVIQEEEWRSATQCFGELCQATGKPFDQAFWHKQVSDEASESQDKRELKGKSREHLQTAAGLLSIRWREVLDRAISEWELQEIARRRDTLRNELEALLELINTLSRQLESLGLEPGILIDLSQGQLSPQDIDQFKRWVQYLANDAGVKALCDVLGKLRQIELSERIEQVNTVHIQDVWQPDPNSREEIIGVRLGRDLEHALPSELALLADSDTSVLFDMKYLESRLMCFDMRGLQLVGEQHEYVTEQRTSETDKMGPMVICLDTSGSMHGMPETIAKAVALYMATKAREQKRDCYLINFSTNIESLDLGLENDMKSLMRFLQMSFHGGTDVTPALKHALDTMQRDQYAKADLLVISDFVMGHLPDKIQNVIEAQRLNGNRFHSLVIDEGFHAQDVRSLFDHEWIYDPLSSQVTELVGFQKRVARSSFQ
ncbi:VWA domain-containing protein [Rhodoferax sp. U11-2br]|uniref:VWA domain-containing protein n=1 Tax=Rhodoferax sp. U11-2br TaxID=2838878 RepID=UPI001BEC13C1|nr:VWA domain-containing protein [Rhodoferax sp. U11-2br]MBT3068789.1 VWA domain-containing protein [Rhodoferax sp. U11-2br]